MGAPAPELVLHDVEKTLLCFKKVHQNEGLNQSININGHREGAKGKRAGRRTKSAAPTSCWCHPHGKASAKEFLVKSKKALDEPVRETAEVNQIMQSELLCMDPDGQHIPEEEMDADMTVADDG